MKMKKILMALALFSLTFAAGWEQLTFTAMMASVFALAILFILGYVLDLHELKTLTKDEMVQLAGTAIMVAAFTLLMGAFSGMHTDALTAIDTAITDVSDINSILGAAATHIGAEGGKSVWCSFSAVGFGTSACAGYRALSPQLSSSFQLTSTALAELSGMKFFVDSVGTWLFTFLFPAGLFLRTFKYTRGAGSLLIAAGLAAYVVLPITFTILFTYVHGSASSLSINAASTYTVAPVTCNEYGLEAPENENNAIAQMQYAQTAAPGLLFYTLIEATLVTVVSIAVMVMSMRYLMSIAGAEVDVQALGRFI